MRVFITGHRGYIGTVMTPLLIEAGHEILGCDSDLYERCTLVGREEIVEVPSLRQDIRDLEVADLLGFDAVIHLAGLSNDPLGDLDPGLTDDINHLATVQLAKLAKTAGVRRFLFSSSCSTYGAAGDDFLDERSGFNPVTPYGKSKVDSEIDLRRLADDRFCPVFLRSATAYGVSPRIRFDLVLNNLVAWAITTGRIHLKSDGTPWRPIVHIEDISRAFLAALQAPDKLVCNQAFNVGQTAHNYRIRELAEIVAQVVPNCRISYAEGAGPDRRCYRVNCDRIREVLPAFQPKWDALRGAQQVYEACRDANLTLEQIEGPRYQRVAHIRKLIATQVLDRDLRHLATRPEGQKEDASADGPFGDAFRRDCQAATCHSCRHQGLLPLLDMGSMPPSDGLWTNPNFDTLHVRQPLQLAYCPGCTLVQIINVRPRVELFGEGYLYFSSVSEDLLEHSRRNAQELISRLQLGPDSLVIEPASNDGYMLRNFRDQGIPVLGIDPAPKQAAAATASGIETLNEFFTTKLAQKLKDHGRQADLVLANNVVAHVEDTNDFVAAMALVLKPEGTLVVEFPYVRDLIDHREFDTIYHEHLCYFSVTSAQALFRRHGLMLNDVRRIPIHGGSLRLYFEKHYDPASAVGEILHEERVLGLDTYAYYQQFAEQVRDFRSRARQLVGQLKSAGKHIAAYGAPAKGTILLNYLGFNDRTLDYVVDKNTYKQGKFIPGVHLRIDPPRRISEEPPDYLMILPWNFKDEIIRQQSDYAKAGGRFIVPIPDLEIIG